MSKPSNTVHLYAGFSGGLTSSLLLQPLDLLKTRLQQSNGATLTKELRKITNIRELWKGTLPSCVRTSVGSGLYLSCLNVLRTNLAAYHQKHDLVPVRQTSSSTLPKLTMQENLATGALARSIIGFCTMPVTILKVRYESTLYNYTSINQAVRSIYYAQAPGESLTAMRGSLRNFFKGYWVTTARDAPNAGLYVLFYEKLKLLAPKFLAHEDSAMFSTSTSAMINSVAAFTSSCLSTAITAPFDTIKTRLQLLGDTKNGRITTSRQVLVHILTKERFVNLFDGLSMRLLRKGLSAGIAWCIYEELVKLSATTNSQETVLKG
ncbi:hypothetical protein BABINDRAFT_160840 [Babjeviella inositovora NRRL Y-12698]|uniref:Mitochondrial glycine transporter n=1 Tax=Babjeviella inositovora NRRL Y-12698 TaxID=984486 RepID=A0A1E3QSG0_9ASCO|nr:uncharacterized protein BABINDRAFT_160840 [Babjeviella inositovora NRRL Y-12698]ODQ80578.1 hypothetical protein BABINDRAFT_160840 [Babjeviella inositovora NRRL Y-12698]